MKKLLPLLSFAAVLAASTAAAQPADPDAEARRLFGEGQKAFDAGDYERAETAYEASYDIKPSFDNASNLGITELKLKKYREAAAHLDYALRRFPPSESPAKRDMLNKLLAEAKSQVASLRIDASVAGARITVNAEPSGSTPLAAEVYADPGKCTIVVEAKGYKTATVELDVGAGLAKTVRVDLEAEGDTTTPPPSDKPLWPAFVFGGVGVAGVAVLIPGFVLSAQARSNADDLAASYGSDGRRCDGGCPEIDDELADEVTFRGMGIGGAVAAGAGALAAILYVAIPGGAEASADAAALRIHPAHGDAAGLFVEGSF
jgi:tetratricopeptide (TPR) repeat protein